MKPKIRPETIRDPNKSSRVTGLLVGLFQLLVIAGVVAGLSWCGFLLFARPLLEFYFEEKTGYPCEIETFDFDPRKAMIELRDVTIWNIDPYPKLPMARVRKLRMEWDPILRKGFTGKLQLLEIELDQLALIRLDGNRFNILAFIEALVNAWGSASEAGDDRKKPSSLYIGECRLTWDYLVAMDEEVKGGKRMELLVEYEGFHKDVSQIYEITDPAIKMAKEKVDTFYFFNYLGDSIRSLLD